MSSSSIFTASNLQLLAIFLAAENSLRLKLWHIVSSNSLTRPWRILFVSSSRAVTTLPKTQSPLPFQGSLLLTHSLLTKLLPVHPRLQWQPLVKIIWRKILKPPPPGTPANDRRNEKSHSLKPPSGADQTKLGLFHAKEGVKPEGLLPNGLEFTPCAFLCFQNKKCTRPCFSCPHPHTVKWDTVKSDDQAKILTHFSNTGNGWLDGETFKKHKTKILANYSFLLLGDASGPKAKSM